MAELVGGAILSGFINVLFERMATPEFMNLFVNQKLDRKLLQNLKTYLTTVNAVLYDAEYRQTALKDASVKYFLEDLRGVAYEADDLLDLIAYEVTAAEIKADQRATAGSLSWNLSSLGELLSKKANKIIQAEQVSMPSSVTKKIEEIVDKLEIQVKQIDPLGLKKNFRNDALPQREPTSSLVEESEIFGRKDEEAALIKSLEATENTSVGVIPIVGIGGIGKTTLAQLVYNDSRVKELFVIRAWVCVSDNYDGSRIKKELLQQVNISAKCDALSPQQIDEELKKSLAKRKYLIILDDLWEIGYDKWNKLQEPLKSGAPGSKIIVTTRIEDTARMVRTEKEHCLDTLNNDSCWQLFKKHAFINGKENESLQSFEQDILKKCGGLPLAAKMLGGVLRGKQEKEECRAILTSKLWELDNEVTAVLMLSYQYLPSHLKQCFAHCAIFPKDYEIRKEEIVQLWTAECFVVKPEGGGESIVDLAEKYFEELVSKSFFQEHKYEYYGSYFLMHDLIHDLAQKVSGEFSIRMDEDNYCELRRRHRHFSFKSSRKNNSALLGSIHKAQFLRTFWSFDWSDYGLNRKIIHEVLNHLRCLRVLSLRHLNEVKLPNSIKHLKHLRYLNLSFSYVKKLPKSVCSLYNLQTLILRECRELVELPKDIENLINLHSLDITKAFRFKKMPPTMGNLKNLCFLSNFIVGKQQGKDLDGLGKLHHLRGKLRISNLQNVVETPGYILKNKNHLKGLKLKWRDEETKDSKHEERVLERLQPNVSINKLSIYGYGGKILSSWVSDSSYTSIVSLKLKDCNYCTLLPEFGRLSSLENLSISSCREVSKVSMTQPLCSLKTLIIRNLLKWEDWCFCEENDSEKCGMLEKLEVLRIESCPKLKTISPGRPAHTIFYSLNTLTVADCPNLKIFNIIAISNFKQVAKNTKPLNTSALSRTSYGYPKHTVILKQLPSSMYSLQMVKHTTERIEEMGISLNALEDVKIERNELCECIPLEVFPVLKSLHLYECSNLRSLSASSEPSLQPLKSLHENMNVLLPSLKHLKIEWCEKLESFSEGGLFGNLQSLEIEFCKKLESFPEGGLPANLKSLEIRNCNDKLIEACWQGGLQALDALSSLILHDYGGDNLNCVALPPALTSLEMRCFKNVKLINCKDLEHLTHLTIWWCPNLESFVQQGLPSSTSSVETESVVETQSFRRGGLLPNLQSLIIMGCDELIGRRLQWGLQRFNSLSDLTLGFYFKDDLSTFPEESLLPSTLTSLTIRRFSNLEVINYKGLQHLTSLLQLEISYSYKLQCLPKEGFPSTLSVLNICGCPLLKTRYEPVKGQDWPKISHISTLYINFNTTRMSVEDSGGWRRKNKSISKGKKGGKKKAVDNFAKKDWYGIVAPPAIFQNKDVGKTVVTRTQGTKIASEGLKHRVFEISLADLQGDEDHAYRKIRLRAEDVQGRNVLTNFWGMDFTADKVRSLVRKFQTLIECHVDVKTTDNCDKPLRFYRRAWKKKKQAARLLGLNNKSDYGNGAGIEKDIYFT